MEGNNAIVTGIVRIPNNIKNEKICINFTKYIDDDEEMSTKDIYKELRLRGYQYKGLFCGLKSMSVTGTNGHIAWTSNWVSFMDNMLQMMILKQKSRSLFVPTKIGKLIIDPNCHLNLIQNCSTEERQLSVHYYKSSNVVISGGIEICGIVATPISRRQKTTNTVLEDHKFIAYRDLGTMSLQDAIRMSVHIALECCNLINIKIIEFVDDSDKVTQEDLNFPFINKILNDLPQIRHNTKLVTTHEKLLDITLPDVCITEVSKLSKDENCLIIMGLNILSKNNKKLYQQLLPLLMPQGFLITLEKINVIYDYSCLKTYELDVIVEKRINDKMFLLLRKRQKIEKVQYQIVHINNYDFLWVNELKAIINIEKKTKTNIKIILVAENFECGLLGLINCLRKESGGEMIKSIFIQDKEAPKFSLQELLYIKQLQLDLPINVLRPNHVWGSYRHFPLPLLEPKPVQNACIKQMVRWKVYFYCEINCILSIYFICIYTRYREI
ncbi:hypothetical protein PUN28_013986 [Cardiocondyla obscurior]|uniref:Fatty acid synthase pseudo-KR domain-containing protein n=1 Tax=Cardiocondyla obscurior TaxID=286306 RepID=A0AAW2F9V9_9HYME